MIFKKRPDLYDYESDRTCKNCGSLFHGKYCSRCGERVIERSERTMLSFVNAILTAFTSLDGKFFRSVMLLFSRPGQLSRNLVDGIQRPYMNMVSLFFVANFFYFLFPSADSLNSNLYSQMNWQRHSELATRMVNERLAQNGMTLEEFTPVYEARSTELAKMFIVLMVLANAIGLLLVNYSRKNLFYEHLIFSFEFYTFLIITALIILPYLFFLIIAAASFAGLDWRVLASDRVASLIDVGILAVFLVRAQKNFYQQTRVMALVRTVALLILLRYTLVAYRAFLFLATMWTI